MTDLTRRRSDNDHGIVRFGNVRGQIAPHLMPQTLFD